MNTLQTTLYRDTDAGELPLPVTVEYSAEPAGGDGRDEPYYGPSVEIQSMTGPDGRAVETTPEEDERLAEEALADAGECRRAGMCGDY